MLKKEFLKKLARSIGTLPKSEIDRSIAYYDELIEDRKEAGFPEEDSVAALGSIEKISRSILDDARERGVKTVSRRGRTAVKVICIVLGVILGLALIGGGAFAGLRAIGISMPGIVGEWEEHTVACDAGNINSIAVNMRIEDLQFKPSADGKVRITYYENKLVKCQLTGEDGSSSEISLTQSVKWMAWLFLAGDHRTTTVYVPAGYSGKITGSMSTGDITLDGLDAPCELTLTDSTGDVLVSNMELRSAAVAVTTGDLALKDLDVAGSITATCTTGRVTISNVKCQSLASASSTGRTSLENVKADSLSSTSTTGEISVTKVDATDIKLKATTGSIAGSLAGKAEDYTITSSVSTGRNNLPGNFGYGPRKLDVHATTGSININFEG